MREKMSTGMPSLLAIRSAGEHGDLSEGSARFVTTHYQ